VAQHYTAPNAHSKSSNTPIVAAVTVDGAAAATGAELAVYVDDELRGLATTDQLVDGKFWVQVYYDTEKPSDTDPTTNVPNIEDLTFKLWDPTGEGTELTDYTLTYTDNGTTLTALTTSEEGWGTPSDPVEIVFSNKQITAMTTGWNWWSTYVEMQNGADGLAMLENSLGSNGLLIKHKNDYLEPLDWGDEILWIGDIESISNEKLYMIKVNAPCDVVINGGRTSVTEHPIEIKYGWNWIGYPHYQQLVLDDALAGFAEDGDIIKNRITYNEYFFGEWIGDIVTLDPGQGYMYYSNSNATKYLTYQTGRNAVVENTNSKTNSFYVSNTGEFERNMTITAVLEMGGRELNSDNFEVAAFVNGECRGSAKIKYVEPLDRYVALLLAFGNDNEDMYFELTDGNNIMWSNEHVFFASDNRIGSLSNPFVLHFGNTGTAENGKLDALVYPNPSNDVFNIQCVGIRKIEVMDVYGQIVFSKEVKDDNHQIDLSNLAKGVYLLQIITCDGIVTKHLVKE